MTFVIVALVVTAGIVLVGIGIVMVLGNCLGLFRLPGDISISGKGWSFSFPIVTCLLLSALLTLISWLIWLFRH